MHYWHSVLDEVLNKNAQKFNFIYTSNGRLQDMTDYFDASSNKLSTTKKEKRDLREYYLGENYPNVHITKREAESLFWLVQGLTIIQTAYQLGLSSRTVEFYVKNLKLKLNCDNKKQLINTILQTNLLEQLEKDGMKITKH